MKRIVYYIVGILTASVLFSCSKISQETEAYKEAMSQVCMDWGADKQTVSDFMGESELKFDGRSEVDYFLENRKYIVTYKFEDGELCNSVLIAANNGSLSVDKLFKQYQYVGDIWNSYITSLAMIYVNPDKNIFATTYTTEHEGASYRIVGFSQLNND